MSKVRSCDHVSNCITVNPTCIGRSPQESSSLRPGQDLGLQIAECRRYSYTLGRKAGFAWTSKVSKVMAHIPTIVR